ncbi:potassium channel family protein [Streptomyces sp. NPDC059740]|uniref:potassium channel family protein n=1 Tax=Streptomyces sp. NPDC059740 TaxID=3346926 RepID=UPI003659568A
MAAPPLGEEDGNGMRMIVVGCGRVGAALAQKLAAERHDVRVIDPRPEAVERLPARFTGRFLCADPVTGGVLESAGVGEADALVACTTDDAHNHAVTVAAKHTHRVPTVVARVHDPREAQRYLGTGIHTVADVPRTVLRMHRLLLHRHLEPELTFGNGETLLVRSPPPGHLVGRPLSSFEVDGEIRLVEYTRGGVSHVPARGTVVHSGDLLTFAVSATSLGRLRDFLARPLGG